MSVGDYDNSHVIDAQSDDQAMDDAMVIDQSSQGQLNKFLTDTHLPLRYRPTKIFRFVRRSIFKISTKLNKDRRQTPVTAKFRLKISQKRGVNLSCGLQI